MWARTRRSSRATRGALHRGQGEALRSASPPVVQQVRHDGREAEDVAAGRDLGAQRRAVQRDRAPQRRRDQHLDLRQRQWLGNHHSRLPSEGLNSHYLRLSLRRGDTQGSGECVMGLRSP